ncbi:MAG TPA: EfeM/EfeO family lipoprotein [Solirubrobacteraceae bacterium]
MSSSESNPGAQPPETGPRRRRRRALWFAGLALLAVLALIGAAASPWSGGDGGSSATASPFGVAAQAKPSNGADQLPVSVTKVFGSNIDAKTYGELIAAQEDQGVDLEGRMTSDLSPIPPRAFVRPTADYIHYSEGWAAKLATQVPALTSALQSNDRAASRRAWSVAYDDYLHLGAVYLEGPVSDLDQRIDGMPLKLAGASKNPNFTGLHRIELGLWTGADPSSLVRYSVMLEHDARKLQNVLPKVQIEPLDYATRAHEILEDAQRDLMSGTNVRWSGAGVLGTAAGLAATQEVIGTLVPMLQGRDNTLGQVQVWLGRLQKVLTQVRDEHHGSWPSLAQLSTAQHDQVNGTLAGTLGALSLVPGTLETTTLPNIPSIKATK